MKKLILYGLLVFTLLLSGCSGGESEQVGEDVQEPKEASEVLEVSEPSEEDLDEIPIYPDEIPWEITILEPDSIGTVYMEATYTNNTEYPITSYSMTVLLKDKNEKTYLSNHDTIMPGDISPKFKTFGPETMNEDDYEILTLDVRARLENGDDLAIDYDFRLEEASWSVYEK